MKNGPRDFGPHQLNLFVPLDVSKPLIGVLF